MDQLSPHGKLFLLMIIEQLKDGENKEANIDELKSSFKESTHLEYTAENAEHIKRMILKKEAISGQNYSISMIYNNMPMPSKLLELLSFRNVIDLMFIFALIVFLISLFYDFNFTRKHVYVFGIVFSFLTLYYRHQDFGKYHMYIVTKNNTCVFGALVFLITALIAVTEFDSEQQANIEIFVLYLTLAMWSVTTIYHQNTYMGNFSVIMLFHIFGFQMFAFGTRAYYVGFDSDVQLIRSSMLSILLTGSYVVNKCHFKHSVEHLHVFEKGVTFWSTFVGCIAVLIMSDGNYLNYKGYSVGYFAVTQVLATIYYLLLIFVGDVHGFSSLKSLGKTFLVMFSLDFQRFMCLKHINSFTIISGIVVANLYGLLYLLDKSTKLKYFS